ncbi:MAG: InlB B-repeat-containing protein [Oscillospiraceae bacterium]|nr:InlB B-repeat-containing protein [Oscillospiraceae bacterium]
MLFWNLTKRTVCILLCVALLLAYAIPSFAEDGDEDIQESGGEPAAAEVADGEYSADGESAQSAETDIEDAAQAASESESDENGSEVDAAESAESESGENSSDGTEDGSSEYSGGSTESISFSALEAGESSGGSEGNEEENQTEVEEAVYAESITLSETSAELLVGSELELEAVITPDDATAEVIWLSGNEDVASVVSGKVTALSAGTATITATVDGLEAVCEVTVYEETDVAFVWTNEITTIVSVRKGTTAEALSIADMPDGEALDEYRTGEYDVAWYIDGDFTEKFDFTTEITEPVTLYAKFLETLSVEYVWSNSQATVSTIFADSCADSLELGDAPEDIQALYDVRYQVIWYSDELLTETYDFESAVTEDLTLYADYDFLPEMEWFADTTKSSYTLVTAAELQSLAALTAAGYTFAGVTIYLGEDETESNTVTGTLDLSGIEWEPIGTAEYPFAGTFDGGIYGEVDGETGLTGTFTLSGLSLGSYKEFDYAGLFGYVTGDIRNVTVSGTVYVTARYAGGIVGWLEGTITNCTNQTNVYNYEADGIIGGIAGYVNGSVYNCVNEGTRIYNRTDGNGIVGGIVGTICGYVTDSVNSGRYVTGKGYAAGGIAGALKSTSQVLRCTNSAQVGNTADSAAGGGIAGEMEESTTVQYCGNTGAITSTAAAGGIVGRLTGIGTVASCFNGGDVTYGKSSRGGGILGYSENGYEDIISLCCNLSTQDGTFLDADYVTATTDAGEAAYIMDNGGSDERYDVWGWINGDKTPSLLSRSQDAAQTYYVKLVASKSRVEALTQNYYPVGDTVTIYAANNLEDGDEWIVKGIDDYEISDEQDCITFVMPDEDITVSVTVANPNAEYTVTFHGYVDSSTGNYTIYSSQTVSGGELAAAPEELDGAEDINAYYAYYEDEDFCGYYVFTGWYLMDESGDLSEQYDFDWMVGEDITLYAEWSLITVQFSFNGVKTTTTLPSSYKIGVGATLTEPTPEPETTVTKTSFLGWSLQSTLSEEELSDTDENWKWIFEAAEEDKEENSENDESSTPTVLALEDTTDLKLLLYAVWGNSITDWVKTYGVSGIGTESDPFIVSTDEQLNAMSELMTEDEDVSGYYFKLSDDGVNGGIFTLTESLVGYHNHYTYYDASQEVDADVEVFEIGEFNGVFNGNGCTVNVTDAQLGMFGILGEDSEVINLKLTGTVDSSEYTNSNDDYYIAIADGDGTSGNLKGSGALAAICYGTIKNCSFAEGEVLDSTSGTTNQIECRVGGLVGILCNGGLIEDCEVSLINVEGYYCGGVAGAIYDGGSINGCTVTGCEIDGVYCGGVVGATASYYDLEMSSKPDTSIISTVYNCKVCIDSATGQGSITGTAISSPSEDVTYSQMLYVSVAGGIAGLALQTEISNCDNYVPISTSCPSTELSFSYCYYGVGGICGELLVGNVSDCTNHSTGELTANAGGAGGIVGYYGTTSGFDGSISNCKNEGKIFATLKVGGIAGEAVSYYILYGTDAGTNGGTITIQNSSNSGDIDCEVSNYKSSIGGVVGYASLYQNAEIILSGCSQSGAINVYSDSTDTIYPLGVGGLIGSLGYETQTSETNDSVNITNCKISADITVSVPVARYVGGVLGSTASHLCEMIYGSSSSSGFTGGWFGLPMTLSDVEINNLNVQINSTTAEHIGGIAGELDISDSAALESVTWDEISINVETTGSSGTEYLGGLAGELILSADDESSANGTDLVYLDFEERTFKNLSVSCISGNYIGGIAGSISTDGGSIICNLSDISLNVSDSGSSVGGLAGQITGQTIICTECADMDVAVEYGNYVGGVVGELAAAAQLSYCSYDGKLSVGSVGELAGGLAGSGNVEYSYFVGTITIGGTQSVGLLAGEGTVVSSFFYGDGPSDVNVTSTEDNITASYYLGSSDENEQCKTESEFKSGYVAWLMEIGGDEEDIGDHAFIWKQASKYPEWSNGEATVYRIGVADDLENVTITLADGKEYVYLNDDDDDGAEFTVTVSEETYPETQGDEEVEYGYALTSISYDETQLLSFAASEEERTTTWTDNINNYTFSSDGDLSAAVTVVQLAADEDTPVAEEEGEGDGSGDDDSEGSGGSGGGDGTGYGGTDKTTAGTSVPTIGSDEEGPTVISDTSPDVQIEETVGDEAPAGGTEAEETVEAPETEAESEIEPEPEPEPEPETEVEPEVHTYELITNIVEAIKENPLLAVLAATGAAVVFLAAGFYRYKKSKHDFS